MFLSVREACVTASRLQTQRSEVRARACPPTLRASTARPVNSVSRSVQSYVRASREWILRHSRASLVYTVYVWALRDSQQACCRGRGRTARSGDWPCRVRFSVGVWRWDCSCAVRCCVCSCVSRVQSIDSPDLQKMSDARLCTLKGKATAERRPCGEPGRRRARERRAPRTAPARARPGRRATAHGPAACQRACQ